MVFIVIPAYNEAGAIKNLLTTIKQVMAAAGRDFKVLVVDDASKDGTASLAESMAGELPVQVLRHERNSGPGKAFDTGIRYACSHGNNQDILVTVEGDNTNDVTLIPALVESVEAGHDVVCASRYVENGKYVGFPWDRWVFSLGANALLRVLFPIPGVHDYTIFYRSYRLSRLKQAVNVYGSDFIHYSGFVGNAEILVKLRALGIKASEVGLRYRYDLKQSKSKMKVYRNLAEYFSFAKANWRLSILATHAAPENNPQFSRRSRSQPKDRNVEHRVGQDADQRM